MAFLGAALAFACGGTAERSDSGEQGSTLRTPEQVCEQTVGLATAPTPHPDCTGSCGTPCEVGDDGATFVCDGAQRCVAVASSEGDAEIAERCAYPNGFNLPAWPIPDPVCEQAPCGAVCELELAPDRLATCTWWGDCLALP
jgi:hypothetical protein